MSDISSAFNSPIILTIDNVQVSFPKFTPFEMADLCTSLKEEKVQQARKLSQEFGVLGIERLKLVREAEDNEFTVNHAWAWACIPKNALSLLEKSLKKSGKTPEEAKDIISKLEVDKAVETVVALMGYKAEEEEDKKEKKVKAKKNEEPAGFAR